MVKLYPIFINKSFVYLKYKQSDLEIVPRVTCSLPTNMRTFQHYQNTHNVAYYYIILYYFIIKEPYTSNYNSEEKIK